MVRTLRPEDWYILNLPFDGGYYYNLRKSLEEGKPCGFCELDPAINPVLFENQHWIITQNAFPNRRACAVMLLIITKIHWRKLSDITPDAWSSFAEIIAWAENQFDLPGGMLFLRFGDMELNGGSIRHLHWNLWVPNKTGRVFAPIYKSEAEMAADRVRGNEFARRYEAGEVPS